MRTAKDLSRAPIDRVALSALVRDITAPRWYETHNKPRARQFFSRVLNRYLWCVHAPSMYDGCGTTLDGAIRVFRANNNLS